jgi:nitrite reductase (NO-forming)
MDENSSFSRFSTKTVCAAVFTTALLCGCGSGQGEDARLPARRSARVFESRPPEPVVQLALHRSPQLHPTEPERLKEVRLDVTHALADLGSDGKFAGWSFGGQIPGPTVRARVGDRIRFTVTNRTEEPIAGLTLAQGPQAFEIAGVLIDREDEHRSIPPGQTLQLEVTAMAPGVHLYRGALPTEVEALAAGMFGMLVVDPAAGFATPAAREFAIVQSELYVGTDAAGKDGKNVAIKTLDRDALTSKRPSHFGYDGRFTSAQALRLNADPGERVRLFVLNAGPHATARFQVQGINFASVWPADVLGAKPVPAGPATLLPGTGAVIELVVPKKGRYRFMDQQLASRGLLGLIDAAQGEPESTAALVIAKPRTAIERRQRAHELYVERCVSCHDPAPGTMRLAPDLAGVTQRRNRAWLVNWLTDPPKMQAEDPTAQELLRQWNNLPMPQVMLSTDQIEWMIEFLNAPTAASPVAQKG